MIRKQEASSSVPTIARRLLHYRSTVDGVEQPYLVCSPSDTPAAGRLPLVIYLHATLEDPTPGGFVEEGFREASAWLPALEAAEPAVFAIPFGRGNAGWLGVGGKDLFDVVDQLSLQFPIDPARVSLVGVGPGATGALQLACWFPGRFSRVAAVGAWADYRLDLPIGVDDLPQWELPLRRSISPAHLARNLLGVEIHLEHPPWCNGLGNTTERGHYDALIRELNEHRVQWTSPTTEGSLVLPHQAPADRTALLEWLTAAPTAQEILPEVRFKTYSARSSQNRWVRIDQWAHPGRPAIVRAKSASRTLRVRTKGVDALTLQLPPRSLGESWTVRIDGEKIAIPCNGDPDAGLDVHLERLSRGWRRVRAPEVVPGAKSPITSGPMMDIRWDDVIFVPGSLGDESANSAMFALAEQLRHRWRSGDDSIHPHPGNRACAIDYAIVRDHELNEETMRQKHLVVIGTPRTNLLLARLGSSLPFRWKEDDSQGRCEMQWAGRRFDDPKDVAVFLSPNPEALEKYLMVVSSNDASCLHYAAKLHSAFLPEFLILRGRRVLDYGWFGADWRAVE